MTNSRILEQFEYSPDILATLRRQKRRQNVFAYRPREGLVRSHPTAVTRAHSTETNKSVFFIRVIYTTIYQRLLTKRGPSYLKRKPNLKIFGNFKILLENFRPF